jgi:methylase of polypeptide subunit release factors
MPTVDATAYLAPYPARRVRRPVLLRLDAHSYPLEPTPEQSWLPVAFRAFAHIAKRAPVEDLLLVGTGNGLDALGAAEILDLRTLAVTELHEPALAVARENVLAHLRDGHGIALSFHAGDLLWCIPEHRRFSLVYENLPNLPAPAGVSLAEGTIGGRFFDADADPVAVPEPFAAHRLALHHRCLVQARPFLRDGGGVLTAIGGRVPHDVAFALHRACGYEPELVAYDVKLQVEPALVIPPYARAEAQDGVTFTFYAPEAIALVARARADGLDGQALADAVAAELAPLAMGAGEAEARTLRGQPVAHSVLMVLGVRAP